MVGQKKVTIINNSPYTIQIGGLATVKYLGTSPPTISGPTYNHKTLSPAATFINITPNGSHTLNNTSSTTKFPFVSVGNVPQITQWLLSSPASTDTSATAYASANATSQVFGSIKFQLVDPVTGAFIGGQTIGIRRGITPLKGAPPGGGGPNVANYFGTGNAWFANVNTTPAYNPLSPNVPFSTVITIF